MAGLLSKHEAFQYENQTLRGFCQAPHTRRVAIEEGRLRIVPVRRTLQLVCLVLIGSLLTVGSSRAADEALINAAKKEGQVVWYTTQIITQFVRPAAEAFQKKYGIKVNFLRGDSVETAVRLLNEGRAGKGRADVFDGTTTLPSLKREGLVLKWLPDAAMSLPPAYRDPEGYWVATNVFMHAPAFNTTLIPKQDAPRSFEDLLAPKWQGAWRGQPTPRRRERPASSAWSSTRWVRRKGSTIFAGCQSRRSSPWEVGPGGRRSGHRRRVRDGAAGVQSSAGHQRATRRSGRLDQDESSHGGVFGCRRRQGRPESECRQAAARLLRLARRSDVVPVGRLHPGRSED